MLVALVVAGTASAAEPRVTFIGDSVPAAIDQIGAASAVLERGLDVRLELAVCRNLAQRSCTYEGETPPSALAVIRASRDLGPTVVVNVGYNQQATGYRGQLDRVMRALRRARVSHVVWVTLRPANDDYEAMNRVIRQARSRWRELSVLEWAYLSDGKPWFWDDGLHLNYDGALALARLVRGKVLSLL